MYRNNKHVEIEEDTKVSANNLLEKIQVMKIKLRANNKTDSGIHY